MRLVIDIPEEDYRKVKDGRASVSIMRKAIANGIPHVTVTEFLEIINKYKAESGGKE